MNKRIRGVKIRIQESHETLDELKDEFARLSAICPNFLRKDLIPFDPYFKLATAKDDIRNLRNGRCGYEKTRRIVVALRAFVGNKAKNTDQLNRIVKRQKLEL